MKRAAPSQRAAFFDEKDVEILALIWHLLLPFGTCSGEQVQKYEFVKTA